MKAEEDRGGSSTWDSFAGGPDAATARVREPYPAGLRSRAALVHGVGAPDPTTRRARQLRTTRPRHARTRHECRSNRRGTGAVRATRRGDSGAADHLHDSTRLTKVHQGRVARPGCRRPSASRPSASSCTPCLRGAPTTWLYSPPGSRAAPSRRLRSGTVVTGTGEGRIITLIHVKHVGRRIGRHADATCAGLNAPLGCHSDETPGGSWAVRRRCRSTRYVRADLSLSHNIFRVHGEWISESTPRNRPTRTVPFEPGNSRGQTP